MEYDSLSKIYYKNPSQHEKIYLERFNAPTTKQLDFSIKQVGRQKIFPAFFVLHGGNCFAYRKNL